MKNKCEIYLDDAMSVLDKFLSNGRKFSLIYIDPPFNTGKVQCSRGLSYKDKFSGLHSVGVRIGKRDKGYEVFFEGTYYDFMLPHIEVARNILEDNGSIFVHLDYREVHYIKVIMDYVFGRENFMNEIIWAYDFGGRSKRYWPRKHDTILWYVMDRNNYIFNYDEIDRIPYMAPGLVGKEKAKRGKTPTDVWWHTIVHTTGKERTGYPTQKPLGVLERIVKVHSNPGDWLLDFFAGSGSFGEAALKNGRNVVLVDNNPDAVSIMKSRCSRYINV